MFFLPFDSRDILYKHPFGAVCENTEVTFRLLLHEDKCHAAFLCLRRDGETENLYPMSPSDYAEDGYRWYVCKKCFNEGLFWYSFCFDSDWGRQYVKKGKASKGFIGANGDEWQLTVYEEKYETPDKFAGGIIYQIFPDRFFRSQKPKNFVPSDRYIYNEFEGTPEYRQQNGVCSLGNDYFGGDLKGITEKLDYIASLGVSIIYLNPIFEAHSNHRYNTADYMKIDSLLGTEDDLRELCEKAKKLGISIILDGVFSHTGDDSRYFNRKMRYSEEGAYNSKNSKYYNWYSFTEWPDKYSAWWGVPSLPETNEENKDFMRFITGQNGVLNKWLDCGVSGWRLDVADELPDSFLDSIRTSVKLNHPDALIIGEVWEDATNKTSYGVRRRYLRGRQLDSVMNYPFASAIIKFLTLGGGDELCETVLTVCENYPKQALRLLMNHIGTHDTVRILTALGGEPSAGRGRGWEAVQKMNESQLWHGKKRLYLAALLQYTLPGIPSLYYGDEAGLEGYGDPFCRGCYPWGKEDGYLLEFYKQLGRFRRSSTVFAEGDFIPVYTSFDVFAFIRRSENEEVLVCVNRLYDDVYIQIDKKWESAEQIYGLLPQNDKLRIEGLGFTVLKLNQALH